MSLNKLLLPVGLLLLIAVSAASAKRCDAGCGSKSEGRLKKGQLQCKACKANEYATSATNFCCTKCKGTLKWAGDVPTCTPRIKNRNSTDDNSKNSTCPTPFLTVTDPATGAKSCLCPAGTFLQPKTATPGRKMLSLQTGEAPAAGRQLLKRGADDVGPDDNPNRGGGGGGTGTPGTDDRNSTSTPGDDNGGRGRGTDDPLVPGDDIARRWTCAACAAGQNPAPNAWKACCTPPAVFNGVTCA